MNGYQSLRENFGPWSEGCSVDDLLWIAGAIAEQLALRGLPYAQELDTARVHVAELWKADRGARSIEQYRRGTSEVGGA